MTPAPAQGEPLPQWMRDSIDARFICEQMGSSNNWQLSALALGWKQNPEIAERYTASMIDGEGILAEGGTIHSVYEKHSQHVVTYVADDNRACMFRAPDAEAMPSAKGWDTLFGIPPEDIENPLEIGPWRLASFKAHSEPRPSMAQFIPKDAIRGDDLLVGLTVLYEFEKEDD